MADAAPAPVAAPVDPAPAAAPTPAPAPEQDAAEAVDPNVKLHLIDGSFGAGIIQH